MPKKATEKKKSNIPGTYRFRPGGKKVQLIVCLGTRFDGKPNYYYKDVDYTTDRQLEIDRTLFYAECLQESKNVSTDLTIKGLFNIYIDDASVGNKQSTQARYRTLFTNQVEPYLGKKKVTAIKPVEIQQWVNHIKEHGRKRRCGEENKKGDALAAKTVLSAHSLLSSLMDYAYRDLKIIKENPCRSTRLPKKEKSKIKYLKEDELSNLLELLMNEIENNRTHVTMIFLFLFTGMRSGEVAGLRWDHVSFDTDIIRIEEARVALSGEGVVTDTPKSDASFREVVMPKFITKMLKQLQLEQLRYKMALGPEYTDSGYVSVTKLGTPQHPRNTYKWFSKFLKRHDLEHTTIHSLRHTHAAMLARLGTNVIDISHRLGHENIRVTEEIYMYLFKSVDNEIANKLDDYILQAK